MLGLRVTIVRWVDDHQPGWVDCHLVDSRDCLWVFIEKAPVVTVESLGPETCFPRPGIIACELVERQLATPESAILVVSTAAPWGIEATSGQTQFEVRAAQVIEMDSE